MSNGPHLLVFIDEIRLKTKATHLILIDPVFNTIKIDLMQLHTACLKNRWRDVHLSIYV